MNQNLNNLGLSMRNSTDIQAHSISLVRDNRVVSLEDYITEIAGDGGGGVQPEDVYTKTETDNLLNAKLNVNNPQDIIGTLRIDSTNGNGKLVVNALGAPNDEDFYVNGLSNLGGTLKCQLLQASSNIETTQQIQSDAYSTNTNSNIVIHRNSIDYIVLESDKIIFKRDIYVNDVLLTGGGGGTFDENVIINNPYELQCNKLNNNGLNQDVVFNINTGEWLRLQFSDNTVRVPNTKSFLSQNIYTDILRPLSFSNDVVFNGGNATSDAYNEYFRIMSSTETVNFSKTIRNNTYDSNGDNTIVFKQNNFDALSIDTSQDININNNVILQPNKIIYFDEGTTNKRYIRSSARSSPSVQNHLDIVQENTTIGRIRLMIGSEENVIVENSQLYFRRIITAVAGIRGNLVNSNGDANLVFQRNDVLYMTFNTDKAEINQPLHLANELVIDTADKLTMKPSLEGGINIFDIRNLHPVVDNPMVRFRVGEGGGETIVCEMTDNAISFSRTVAIGTTYGLKSNVINTNGDNDLIFQRNGTEYFKLSASDNLILASDTARFSAPKVYANEFLNRTLTFDTVFYGANSTSDGRVEYMKWGRTAQSLDFNAPVDNTGLAVIGNIADTTVSDERLKTNIQDIESNFTDCVKHVKVKTFEYTDEKYKK